MLLTRCQKEFETDYSADIKYDELVEGNLKLIIEPKSIKDEKSTSYAYRSDLKKPRQF